MNKKRLLFVIIAILILLIKLYYDYRRFNNISFELKGREEIYLTVNDNWNDPGYTCIIDGEQRNDLVVRDGTVDAKEGTYLLKYNARVGFFTKTLIRKINVLNIDNEHFYIKLNGSSIIYLMNGQSYHDDGVKAYDEIDGILDNEVVVSGNVDETIDGSYEITYTVTNSASVEKKIKRTVVVYSFAYESSLKNKEYAQDEEVAIKITDNRYEYTILPNKEMTREREIKYNFQENGLYSFIFYDSTGNSLEYDLEIKNIDRDPPTGTCILSLYDNSGRIDVDVHDNSGIANYVYYYGLNQSSALKNNYFTFNTLDDTASAIVTDMAGNTQKLNCSIIDKSTVIPRSYNSFQYNNTGYWLYIPQTTKRKKLPVLLYLHGDGGRGSDLKLVNNYAFPSFINNGEDFPFIMIAPQCHKDENFTSDGLIKKIRNIIDIVLSGHNVDKNRIMIAGGSSGARGAYKIAAIYKDLFSCLVIGSGSTSDVTDAKELTYLPIYIFHGKNDNRINISGAMHRADSINQAGGNATFVALDGDHDVTETFFKDSQLIEWMLNQVKK